MSPSESLASSLSVTVAKRSTEGRGCIRNELTGGCGSSTLGRCSLELTQHFLGNLSTNTCRDKLGRWDKQKVQLCCCKPSFCKNERSICSCYSIIEHAQSRTNRVGYVTAVARRLGIYGNRKPTLASGTIGLLPYIPIQPWSNPEVHFKTEL